MILVVDDDRDVRDMLCDVLAGEGYAVTGARNGREALATLRANPADICLVLLDVMMPVMSGVEFREQQRIDPDLAGIPVAVMSARWEARDVFDGLAFLRKPMGLEEILTVVRGHCSPMSDPRASTTVDPQRERAPGTMG